MEQSIWNRLGVGALLAAGTVFVASAAHAEVEGSGGYFGVSAGQAMASDYCETVPGGTLTSCDDGDTTYRIFGGYKFHSNLAIEGAYVNLGEYPASGTYLAIPFNIKTEITGFTVQAVGMIPLGDSFTLLGRAGGILWNIDTSGQVGGFYGSASDDGVDVALGIGAQFNFTRNVALRADFDLYPGLGNDDTGEEDLSTLSVGLVFSF